MQYLGLKLECDGHSPDVHRIKLICDLPAPTDQSTLRSFLGLIGFLWELIENFVSVAVPLYILLTKGVPRQWGQEQKQAFMALKRTMVRALAYPHMGKPFYLELATTHTHVGTILYHQLGTTRKPVAYSSRELSEVERNFSPCEREVLALVWALGHWDYLIGMFPVVLRSTLTS